MCYTGTADTCSVLYGVVCGAFQGSCPSFYPLPGPTPGAVFETEYAKLSAAGALPTHVVKVTPAVSVGTYLPGAPKVLGSFKPTKGFEDLYACLGRGLRTYCPGTPPGSYGQTEDNGGHYNAAKDSYYPPSKTTIAKYRAAAAAARAAASTTEAASASPPATLLPSDAPWRRINWGWLIVGVNNAQGLPREVTFNPVLRQLEWAPIEEQKQLRSTVLFNKSSIELGPTAALNMGLPENGAGRQMEVEIVFELPTTEATFGLVVLTGGPIAGVSTKPI